MNGYIIAFGVFVILCACPVVLLENYFLSSLGVPSVSDIGKQMHDALPVNEEAKELGAPFLSAAKFIENLPLYLFLVGVVIVVIGLVCPG